MKTKVKIVAILVALFTVNLTFSQTENVKGKVISSSGGLPLPGVNVIVKGSQNSTTTDVDGSFILKDVAPKSMLVFSFIGFKSQEVAMNSQKNLVITLVEESAKLDEVVVIGYGTQKKKDLTGAVGIVNVQKTMTSRSVTNIQELLAGSVPGLNVTKASGAPGSGASLNIRGTSTIGGSSGVLVIIDGFPGNIYTLNPNDIESISVLKDAASAAIYGSRAANGVLLVTTKKGKNTGKAVVEINTSMSTQTPQFQVDFVGSADYMKLWDQGLKNDGKPALYGAQGLADLAAGKYADNKWYKEIYKQSSLLSNQFVSVSGSSDAITYRIAGSYDSQEGTLPNNDYKRYVFHPYMSVKVSSKLKIDANIQYTQTYVNTPQGGTDAWQVLAARIAPIYPIYTKNGQYATGSANFGNPIAGENEGGFVENKYLELFTIIGATYTPLKNWNIVGNFARTSLDQQTRNRSLTYNLYNDNGDIVRKNNLLPSLTETYTNAFRNTYQITTDYSYTLNEKHSFKILGGFSEEQSTNGFFSAYRELLPFSNIHSLATGSSANQQTNGSESEVAIQSLFSRLNYEYDGRYLFQVNVRADGSSRFASGHKWGTFPSLSAGWNVHKESFFKVPVITQLKLRASWGTLGDAEKVGAYATANILDYNPQIYGFNGNAVPGALNSIAVDKNITWELSKQTNLGIDLGFFNQKVVVSADYFYNKRQNILTPTVVPVEFGLSGPVSNLYKLDNSGFEFLIGYNDNYKDFRWGTDFNFSFSKNKVVYIGEGSDGKPLDFMINGNSYTKVGSQLNLPYGQVADGLFQNSAEVLAQNQGVNIFPGNIKYKDVDGNGVVDGNDRAVLNNKVPIRFGFNLNFGWRDFDFSVNGSGSVNGYRYISGYEGWAFYLSQNARPWALDNWTPENPDASYPRISLQNTANDTRYSSFWLKKASYLKFQNIQIGYNFPKSLLDKIKITSIRTYVSVQNLATISDYPGFDPEGGYYPVSRTIALGFNFKF